MTSNDTVTVLLCGVGGQRGEQAEGKGDQCSVLQGVSQSWDPIPWRLCADERNPVGGTCPPSMAALEAGRSNAPVGGKIGELLPSAQPGHARA